eukprot:1491795-Pyramimonas_sp.AAC.1
MNKEEEKYSPPLLSPPFPFCPCFISTSLVSPPLCPSRPRRWDGGLPFPPTSPFQGGSRSTLRVRLRCAGKSEK